MSFTKNIMHIDAMIKNKEKEHFEQLDKISAEIKEMEKWLREQRTASFQIPLESGTDKVLIGFKHADVDYNECLAWDGQRLLHVCEYLDYDMPAASKPLMECSSVIRKYLWEKLSEVNLEDMRLSTYAVEGFDFLVDS